MPLCFPTQVNRRQVVLCGARLHSRLLLPRAGAGACLQQGMILASDNACCVQIGRDPRISGPLLAAALAAGLTSKGVKVARFGYATTPAMFMSTIIQGERQAS